MKFAAEWLGTMLLLAAVVGSGIMGESLAQGNAAVALLANAAATAGALYVLITILAPISGAHLNPAVTLVVWARGEMPLARASGYIAAQVCGAVLGVLLAHAMFDMELLQSSARSRAGIGQWASEAVATFGLLLTILLGMRHRPAAVGGLVASYIFAAYWFTASTSFANPAVTLARTLTDTFAGMRPADAPAFVLAQAVGAMAAALALRALTRRDSVSLPSAST